MQHFLKAASRTARTEVVTTELFYSSLSPWTILVPRLTCVSEGNPLRRLLLRVKGRVVGEFVLISHGEPSLRSLDLITIGNRSSAAAVAHSALRAGFAQREAQSRGVRKIWFRRSLGCRA